MLDTSKLQRSHFLSKTYRNILNEKNITIQEVADKLWNSHAYISQNLSWKKVPSDQFYNKIWKAIWLTDKKILEIFKKADKEEFKYKYWEDLIDPNLLENIDFDVALKREYWKDLNADTIAKIKEFIEFVKNK